jgi:hypothetical protein
MANDPWTSRTQQATLEGATKWGEVWTTSDLQFVEAFADLPDAEVARALGRTLFAVQTIKHAIRAGRVSAGEAAARRARVQQPAAYRGWTCDMGEE